MSIFSGGKKWGRRAKQLRVEAAQAQEDLEDLNFGRDLLANIRQQRLAAAQLRLMEGGASDVATTSYQGQMANVNSALASDYGYSVDVSNRAQAIERLQDTAIRYEKKAAKMDKRAGIAGMAVAAAAGLLTGGAALAGAFGAIGSGALGATVAAGIGGAAATGVVSATGGGRAAVAGGVQGTMTAMSAIGALGAAGVGSSSAAGATGAVTESSGATTTVTYASEAGTASTTFTEVSPVVKSVGYGQYLRNAMEVYSLYNKSSDLLRGLPRRSYYEDERNRGYKA